MLCRWFLLFSVLLAVSHSVRITRRSIAATENDKQKSKKECITLPEAIKKCTELLGPTELETICVAYSARSNVSVLPADSAVETVNLRDWIESLNIAKELEDENTTEAEENWRTGQKSITELNRAMLQNKIMTDCTFVVGPNQTKIEAHRVILARASPLFESLFAAENANNQVFTVADVSVTTFNRMLDFLYTGEACIADFDEACELSQIASIFRLPDFAEYARSYIWAKIYPNNVWRAFQCAAKSNDTKLRDMAIEFAVLRTDATLLDKKFTDIPQEALVALLAKDNLNVRSELQLIDASLRWAMIEAGRQRLPPGPESMRTALGPALSLLRFLTLTPSEFANLQSTTKLLTYSESLAVIFNINSPGVVSMPDNLSNSTEPRAGQSTDLTYFDVFASSKYSCPSSANTDDNGDVFDVLTSRNVQVTINSHGEYYGPDYPPITGIQFPSQISCTENNYNENFTVVMESPTGQILYRQTFTELVSCTSFILKKFENEVQLTENGKYKFKVILHQSGRYPRWKSESSKQMPYRWSWNGINNCAWQFPDNSFIFSVITNCNNNYYNDYGRTGYVLA